jgi:hypothetical protein
MAVGVNASVRAIVIAMKDLLAFMGTPFLWGEIKSEPVKIMRK